MPLYSLRTDASGDTITKFSDDGNPEATYRVAPGRPGHCDCPAGQRPTCRHRQMLPYLRPYANSPWFLDWDRGREIVDFRGTPKTAHDQVAQEPNTLLDDIPLAEVQPASTLAATPTPLPPASWRRM